ncbi:MAG: cyclodeaminase/cyclohydrolase family protein [Streptosporangiales bacterium]
MGAFLDRIAERTPAPGGGGACAVTIGMAAALVAMAARYSGKQLPDADALATEADELRADALPLVQADADAYGELLAAFRDRSEGRGERVAVASRRACDVPLRMTDVAARTANLAVTVASRGNPNLRGDATTAALLCAAASRSAAHLVRINVAGGGLDPQLLEAAGRNATAAATAAEQLEGAEET